MKVFSDNTSNKLLYIEKTTPTKFNRTKINFINKLDEGTVGVTVSSEVKTKQKKNLTAALEAIETQITNL
jgi:hypothetical protein